MQYDLGPDWFSPNKDDLAKLITKDMTIIEVGSFYGRSSTFFASNCRRLYCIDHWLGSPTEVHMEDVEGMMNLYDQFMHNMRDFDNVTSMRCWSTIGLKYLKLKGVEPDLIYVDGSHCYIDVLSDIRLADQFKGAIICGDDYGHGNDNYGVRRAVDQFVAETGYKLKLEGRGWIWRIIR